MKNMKLWISLVVLCFVGVYSHSQTIQLVNPALTPEQAVKNILLGQGINAFNITYNGSQANAQAAQTSVREFTDGGSNFPISNGVLLQTNTAPTITDPDLDSLIKILFPTPNNITNGVVLEFDFVPTGDTLSFSYIFASEEYQLYTCSQFTDVFGFFISGPGINGGYSNNAANLAIIPGSDTIPGNSEGTPVAINTVNSGTASPPSPESNCQYANPNWKLNSNYFTTTYNGAYNSLGYTGSTVILTANSDLTCGDTFHIKMAIANVSDQKLNSGVFLQANSFGSNMVDIEIKTGTSTSDSLLIEGCTEGTIYFSRPIYQSDDPMVIHFSTDGTVTEGDDYAKLVAGDSLILAAGQSLDSLTISPIQDGISEGPESLTISTYTINKCGDTIRSEGTIWFVDEPHSVVSTLDTTVLCIANEGVELWATTSSGADVAPFTYTWENINDANETYAGDTVLVAKKGQGTYSYLVTSTDKCGFEYTDTAELIINQTLAIDSLLQQAADCGMTNGEVVGYVSGTTGTPIYTWKGPKNDSVNPPTYGDSVNQASWNNIPAGWYIFTVEDDVCFMSDSILVQQNGTPQASFDANPQKGIAPLNVTFVNTSDQTDQYIWDFGNGKGATVSTKADQYATYDNFGQYKVTLTAINGTCQTTVSKLIDVLLPIEYDMPNVFTPNGDGINDLFTINQKNATALTVVILNRWGNVVFESDDLNFIWDGKTQSGSMASEGTYFYKFIITNQEGEDTTEHGFVQLVMDKTAD